MDLFVGIIILLLIYLINPLKNEDKIITTPYITIFYIISITYILNYFNIPNYKFIYVIIPVIVLLIYIIKKKKIVIIPKIENINKIELLSLLGIIILSIFISYLIFPRYPCDLWDATFHSLSIKHILITNHLPNSPYLYGYHSIIYIFTNIFYNIPNVMYFFNYIWIILFIVAHYYIGKSIKDDLGLYVSFFALINFEIYRMILRSIYANVLGVIIFLFLVGTILKYRNTKDRTYLYIFSLGTFSLILTHPFPTLMLCFFLFSLILWELIYRNYKDILLYIIHFSIPSILSYIILKTKIETFSKRIITAHVKKIVDNGHVITYIPITNFYEFFITVFAGLTTCLGANLCLYILGFLKFDNNFFICLVSSITFLILFIFGSIYFMRNRLGFFNLYIIIMIFWLMNRLILNLKIPYFSFLYNSSRWFHIFQIFMPIFYGSGLYYINKKFKSKILPALLIIFVILGTFLVFTEAPKKYWNFYVVDKDEISAFNYINKMNISNELFLNFGHDAGMYLPIFTNNTRTFYYLNNYKYHGVSSKNIIKYTYDYNYSALLKFCKENNIKYIYISKKSKVNRKFFNNSKYFEVIYNKNNISILKIND